MKDRKPSFEQMVALAKVALREGHTRGQFIRENTKPSDSRAVLQMWSYAYSGAVVAAEQQSRR